MNVLKPIAITLATVATLSCGASNVNATYSRANVTTSAANVRVCRGDPPTLPCYHVDVGR
jgi:hypothetical protein